MGISASLWNISSNIHLILTNKISKNRTNLLSTYLKLILKSFLFVIIFKVNLTKEKIFGFEVNFFNYPTFILLFDETFIKNDYYFNTKEKKPTIIDCGSNIGVSLIFFKKLYPKSKIIVFEPDKKTFEKLKINAEHNNFKDVELLNKAVYDSKGTINFYYDPKNPGSLAMSTDKKRFHKSYKKVDSNILSNYIKKSVDFLKLDIEGAETLVIEELSKKNKLKLIKQMVIEYHHHIDPKDDKFSKILRILEENGFGYQIRSTLRSPLNREKFQDILIYAYKK